MEERKQQEDKRRRQKMTKKSLDYSLKLKMKHRAKEVQEELAFDMKLLEQMLTESSNEAKDNLERKVIFAVFQHTNSMAVPGGSLGSKELPFCSLKN